MPELGFVGFRLGFANPRFELRQLMGVRVRVKFTVRITIWDILVDIREGLVARRFSGRVRE